MRHAPREASSPATGGRLGAPGRAWSQGQAEVGPRIRPRIRPWIGAWIGPGFLLALVTLGLAPYAVAGDEGLAPPIPSGSQPDPDAAAPLQWLLIALVVLLAAVVVGLIAHLIHHRRVEGALRAREEMLSTVFASAKNVAFFVTDVSGSQARVLSFSPGAEAIFGWSAAEMVDQPVRRLYPATEAQNLSARFHALKVRGEGTAGERRLMRKSGETFPALYNTYPLTDETGAVTRRLCVAVDITARKEAEEALHEALAEQRALERIVNRSPAVAFRWRAEDGLPVEYVSRNVAEVLGHEPAAFTSGAVVYPELIHPDDREAVDDSTVRMGQASDERDSTREYRVRTPHRGVRWVRDHTWNLLDAEGRTTHYQGLVLDVTERREAEEELRRLNEGLESRVRERTEELEKANRVLRKEVDSRRKAEEALIRAERLAAVGTLAGGVAHEFNNINVAVLGFSQMALAREDLDPELRDWIERIETSAQRARDITGNLMTFAGMRAGHRASANLSEVARESLAIVEPELRADGIAVETDLADLPATAMDKAEIGQVVVNLLINARHALLGVQQPRLRVQTLAREDRVVLRVGDNGCGIPRERLPDIFTPFYSTKGEHAEPGSIQAQVRGTGLGLSVSHRIVERHGGEITVKSEPETGALFTVALPAEPSPRAPEPEGSAAEAAPGAGRRILVLDDEEDTCLLLKAFLGRHGHAVRSATDGAAGLALLRAEPADLLIVDWRMPRMEGTRVVEALGAALGADCPPILLVTGQSEDPITPETSAVAGILHKPFDLKTLAHRVAALTREDGP